MAATGEHTHSQYDNLYDQANMALDRAEDIITTYDERLKKIEEAAAYIERRVQALEEPVIEPPPPPPPW